MTISDLWFSALFARKFAHIKRASSLCFPRFRGASPVRSIGISSGARYQTPSPASYAQISACALYGALLKQRRHARMRHHVSNASRNAPTTSGGSL